MRPPAFTPGLKGRLGLPPVEMICFVDDWAWVMITAAVTKANTGSTRMGRSSCESVIVYDGPPEGGHYRSLCMVRLEADTTGDSWTRIGSVRLQPDLAPSTKRTLGVSLQSNSPSRSGPRRWT